MDDVVVVAVAIVVFVIVVVAVVVVVVLPVGRGGWQRRLIHFQLPPFPAAGESRMTRSKG